MAQNTRRVAGGGVRTECNRRGGFDRFGPNPGYSRACVFPSNAIVVTSNEIIVEKQNTSNEEVIRAGHFSYSGGLARVYRWTQYSRDRKLARNCGRRVVGSLDSLSRRSRSHRD